LTIIKKKLRGKEEKRKERREKEEKEKSSPSLERSWVFWFSRVLSFQREFKKKLFFLDCNQNKK
jgi:hypothetical protein